MTDMQPAGSGVPSPRHPSSAVETRNQRDNRGYLGCWVAQAYYTARAVKLIRLLPRIRSLADPGDEYRIGQQA